MLNSALPFWKGLQRNLFLIRTSWKRWKKKCKVQDYTIQLLKWFIFGRHECVERKKYLATNLFYRHTQWKNSDLLLLLDSHFAKTATIAQPRHYLTWLLGVGLWRSPSISFQPLMIWPPNKQITIYSFFAAKQNS